MAVAEVDVLRYQASSKVPVPVIPTYGRPEHLARVVRLLNEYYRDMADVEEWEAEVPALAENAAQLRAIAGGLVNDSGCMMKAVGYAERVGSSGGRARDAVFDALIGREREAEQLLAEASELEARRASLAAEAATVRGRWATMTEALSELTPLQREVLEKRHRWGISMTRLALSMHYERQGLGMAYWRALGKLAGAG